MLTIEVASYCPLTQVFNCIVENDLDCSTQVEGIPEIIMPYIATDVYDLEHTGEAPFGMLGVKFTLRSELCDLPKSHVTVL